MKNNKINKITFLTIFIFITTFFIAMTLIPTNFRTIRASAMQSTDSDKMNKVITKGDHYEFEKSSVVSGGGGRSDNIGIISGTDTATLGVGDLTNVKHISNSNYFLINPQHRVNDSLDNPGGTCTTVAMQMLIGYHNYYSDRRLIPETSANGTRFLDASYGDLTYDPTFQRATVGDTWINNDIVQRGCEFIGTQNTVYQGIFDATWISDWKGIGQAVGLVTRGAGDFLNENTNTDSWQISSGFFSKSEAISDINAGNPIILGIHPFNSEKSFHVIPAYGYAKLDGVDGFLVHYGWGDSRTQVWLPASWCAFQIRMSVDHTHTLIDTGSNINDTHRQLDCTTCGYSTLDNLYSISDSTITEVKYPITNSITIPNSIDIYSQNTASFTTQPITNIGASAFANKTAITSITLPNSVTSIGSSSFENCTSLASVSSLSSVQSIEANAFKGCGLLTDIFIPYGLTKISDGVFAGCDNLNISVSASNPNYSAQGNILYNKAKTRIISSGKVTASVTIPSTVSEIGPYAFDGNNNLTTLEIENTPTIGMYAFANCENLNSVYFYSYTVPSMGVNAFMNNNFALYVPHSKQPAYNNAFVGYINSIDSIAVKIIFVSEGENVGVKNTYYGATISDLAVPFKEGYDFSGWYDNPSFTGSTYANGGLWNTTENMTLYAKFTPKKYYIIFDGTGSENLEDKEVTYDSPIGSLPVIEIEGYTFAGWKNSRNEYYTEDQIWKDLNNVTLTSDVFSASYIVTLDKQGGGAAGSNRVDPIYLSPMPSATAPTRNGYTFQGYFSQEGGTGTKYYNSDMTSAKNWDIAGDRTLYAYWIGNQYTITLNNQNTERFNTNLTSMSSSNVNYISFIADTSGTITLWTSHTSGDPYLTLYDKNLKILTYNDDGYGDLDSKITYSVVGGNRYVVGFRALSSKKTVGRVYYSGVSISYSNIFVEVGVTFGATMPTTGIPTPTKEGHTFIQYNTDPGGQGTSYYYGPNIASDSRWDRTTDTTLYAIWEKKQYTLSFVVGNNLDYTVPLFNGDTIMADELYVWKHKEFKGYYDGPNGTGTKYVGVKLATFGLYTSPAPDNLGKVWNQNANLTLYAYWVPMVMDYYYRIDVAGGGTLPSDKIHIKSGEVTTLNAPVIEGYTFESWNANGRECTNGSTYTFELHHSYRTGLVTIYHYNSGVSPLGLDGFLHASYTKNPECVAEGTLITLADGSQKAVELLTGNEMLLVWNMHTGKFDVAPILFIDSGAAKNHKVINLHFSDGTIVKVIYEHGFWNYNLNKYVFLRDDASQYIGQYFNKQITKPNGKIKSIKVQLVDVVISTEFVSTWSPVTYGHLNYYVNGMLSMPGATEGLINIFEVNEKKMKIDKTAFEADIETYGLFTYEEFNELFGIPQVIFEAFGGQYLKVSIGKGLITEEKLGQLIESYSKFFQVEETETDESINNCNNNIGDS